MNFAEIERLWRSHINQPTPAQIEKEKVNFEHELRRRRRGDIALIAIVAGLLAFQIGTLIHHQIARQPGSSTWDIGREWGALVFLLLVCGMWGWLVCSHLSQRRRYPPGVRSISETLDALLEENRSQLRRYRLGAVFFALSVPLVGVVVMQLRAVGKAGDEILFPALVIYPLYVCALIAYGRWHYVKRLLPRQEALSTALRSYGG